MNPYVIMANQKKKIKTLTAELVIQEAEYLQQINKFKQRVNGLEAMLREVIPIARMGADDDDWEQVVVKATEYLDSIDKKAKS